MRPIRPVLVAAAVLLAGPIAGTAQTAQPPGPAQAYKPVAVALPKPIADASFDAMRKQLAEAAQRKDRAALARLVVDQGFFWERQGGSGADKRRFGIDNLATALSLNNKDGAGWDILSGYADDPSASPSPKHKGAVCAPADPAFDAQAFGEILKATQSDASEWGYPVSAGIEVHAAPQANAAVIDRLGLAFVRVSPEAAPVSAAYLRIVTPGGKTGYVSVDTVAPIGNDQICYVKDAGGWKIGGYIGGGEAQ